MISLVPHRPRAFSGTAVVLIAVLALTGCSSPNDARSDDAGSDDIGSGEESLLPAPEGTTTYPLTLESVYGESVLPERPERIAVVGFNTNFDYLEALGVTPVYAITEDAEWEWRDQGWLSEIETIDTVTRRDELSFEEIAAAEPDLILALGAVGDEIEYEKLSTIAPVVGAQPEGEDGEERWQAQQLRVGEALDLSAAAQAAVDGAEAEVAAIVKDHPEFAGRTITYATEYSGGYGFHYQSVTGSLDEASFLELGFVPNPLAENFVDDTAISDENLILIDADVLIVNYADEDGREARESQPLFQSIPAVAEGRYLSLTDNPDSGYTTLLRADGEEVAGGNASWVMHRGPSSLSYPWALRVVADDWLAVIDLS